ncbi:MAG: hypothetical protein AAF772_05290 [Acidobacteriota bacterium]
MTERDVRVAGRFVDVAMRHVGTTRRVRFGTVRAARVTAARDRRVTRRHGCVTRDRCVTICAIRVTGARRRRVTLGDHRVTIGRDLNVTRRRRCITFRAARITAAQRPVNRIVGRMDDEIDRPLTANGVSTRAACAHLALAQGGRLRCAFLRFEVRVDDRVVVDPDPRRGLEALERAAHEVHRHPQLRGDDRRRVVLVERQLAERGHERTQQRIERPRLPRQVLPRLDVAQVEAAHAR